jgi:hypothetical protein
MLSADQISSITALADADLFETAVLAAMTLASHTQDDAPTKNKTGVRLTSRLPDGSAWYMLIRPSQAILNIQVIEEPVAQSPALTAGIAEVTAVPAPVAITESPAPDTPAPAQVADDSVATIV